KDSTGYPVRLYLVGIIAGALIPALVLAGWLANRSASSARLEIEKSAQLRARNITAAVDREIVAMQSILAALATSHSLESGDWEAFHRQAAEVARRLQLQIVLRKPHGNEQLINTAFAWGTPLKVQIPFAIEEATQELQRTGQPVVSNLIYAPL